MNYLILDTETSISNKGNPFDKTNKLMMIGYSTGKEVTTLDIEFSIDPYKELLNSCQLAIDEADVLVGFNIKFDLHWLKRYGINFSKKRIWDCQLVEFMLRNQTNSYPSLNNVSEYYELGSKLDEVKENYWKNGIDTDKVPKELLQEYLIKDVELTYQVMLKQKEELINRPELIRLIALHNKDLLVLEEMEYNGLKYEYDKSTVIGDELEEHIATLDRRLFNYHKYNDFNPNSLDHLNALLYGGNIKTKYQVPIGHYKTGEKAGQIKMKWEEKLIPLPRLCTPLKNTESIKDGMYKTNVDTLKKLKGNKDLLDLLLRRGSLIKLSGTYYQGLPKLIDEMNWNKNIIHGQLNQCVTKTGRLSSSKPNLQNFVGDIKSLFTTRYEE